jgi:tetratricopeptide (TPR) repeat protein
VDDDRTGLGALLAELKRRKVYRVGVFYAGAVFVLWQVAEIGIPAVGLPPWVLTVIVAGSLAGFPVVVVLAWLFEVRRDEGDVAFPLAPSDWRTLLERGPVFRWATGGTLALAALVVAYVVIAREPLGPDDSGTRVAVFPFATVSLDEGSLGEGIAELVAVGLDGIPGLNVVDPAALWPPILQAGVIPAAGTAERPFFDASRRFEIRKYVTGTVVQAGTSLDVSVRFYDGKSGDEVGSLRASAPADSLSVLVDRLIVDLVAELWEWDQLPEVVSIERYSTSDPVALQSYLEAMHHLRRGDLEQAEQSIELAVARDSTFALAHLAHFRIRSWVLGVNAQPLIGLQEIVQRAARHQERLTPRNRLRVSANLALNRTDGRSAMGSLERILEVDPQDVDARTLMAFTVRSHGWQFGQGREDALAAYDQALALDSLSLPLLDGRAGMAIVGGEDDLAEELAARMQRIAPESPLTRGVTTARRVATAPDETANSVMQEALQEDLTAAISALVTVRQRDPSRAEAWARTLMERSDQIRHRSLGQMGLLQLWLGRGRLAAVDSLMRARPLDDYPRLTIQRRLVAAALVGVGDLELAAESAAELATFVPADSLVAYIATRSEAWAAGWAVGAYHAAFGDTVMAIAYRDALEDAPHGGIPNDWPDALTADIEARLAVRGGRLPEALTAAQIAFDTWTIHDAWAAEWYPEPAIRFHLADLLRRTGRSDEAAPLYQSFAVGTWAGFFTPIAALRLAEYKASQGENDEAGRLFRMAVDLWEPGDAAVVGKWLALAQEGSEAN